MQRARERPRELKEQCEAELLARLRGERPRITAANAAEWPPPYPPTRTCACKRYVFVPAIAAQHPRRVKKKDPFTCKGNRKDHFVCQSPCSGDPVHFTLSEPHIDPVHVQERLSLMRSYLVSETSELLRWYAQLTGKLWLPWHQLQSKDDAGYIFQLTIFDLECVFEKAFSQWRQLVMQSGYAARQRKARRQAERRSDGGGSGDDDRQLESEDEGEESFHGCDEDGVREGVDEQPTNEFGEIEITEENCDFIHGDLGLHRGEGDAPSGGPEGPGTLPPSAESLPLSL